MTTLLLRKILKNGSVYFFGNLFNRGLSLVVLPFLARLLSPEEYGKIDLVTTVSTFTVIFVGLEITQAVARYYTEAKELGNGSAESYTSTALWFFLSAMSLFSILLFAVYEVVNLPILSDETNALIIVLPWFWLNGLYGFASNQLKWELKVKEGLICNLLSGVLSSALSVLFLLYTHLGFLAIFLGQSVGFLAGIIASFYFSKSTYKICFSLNLLKEMLGYSLPLVFSSASVFIASFIDRIMISEMLNLKELGYYGVAFRLASVASLFIGALQMSITPLIYKYNQKDSTPKELSKAFSLYVLVAMVVFLASTLLQEPIVRLFLGSKYEQSAHLFPLLTICIFMANAYIFSPGLALAKKTKMMAIFAFISALLNTILNYILIPSVGVLGAVVASFFSSLLASCLYIYFGQAYYRVPYNWNVIIVFFIVLTTTLIIKH